MSLRARSIDRTSSPALSPVPVEEELPLETYRQVFVSLDLSPDIHPVIGVTSAIAGEGRTTVALGLARTLAHDLDCMVSLIDADLERPSLAERFDLNGSFGLADVLRGEMRLADVRCLVAPNLCVVTAGTDSDTAAGLLRQLPINNPFHGREGLPGVTILDLPPLLGFGYSSVAARAADAILLVVRAGVTPAEVVREGVVRLEDRPPRGVVLNGLRSSLPAWWPERGL